jgi:hypothetical protein
MNRPRITNVTRKNPLDLKIEEVNAPVYVNLDPSFEPDLFFDGRRFFLYLHKNFFDFDVATYSITGSSLKIRRLITGLELPTLCDINYLEHKHITNNHSKIFLCYETVEVTEPTAAFVGSHNLTASTNFNITIKVRDDHLAPVVNFFNSMWKAKST